VDSFFAVNLIFVVVCENISDVSFGWSFFGLETPVIEKTSSILRLYLWWNTTDSNNGNWST